MRRNLMATILVFCLSIVLTACGESSGDGDDESGDTLTIGDSEDEDSGVGLVVEDIDSAEENYSPGSLEVDESELLLNNPCEGVGFLECQPRLLKEFLTIGRRNLTIMSSIIADTAPVVNTLKVGKGSETIDDAPGVESVAYNIISADKYKLIIISEKGPFAFLSVNREDEDERVYTLAMNFENASDDLELIQEDDEGEPPRFMKMSLTFKDGDDFILVQKIGPQECDDDDVRQPQNLVIDIVNKDGLHKGKTTLYHPRWLISDSDTCDLTPTEETEMILMHEFAGDDTNSTTNIYMTKRGVEVDELSDYAISNFCDNFPTACTGTSAFGSDVTTFPNPSCIKKAGSTFGGACSDIAVSKLSDSDRFVAPGDILDVEEDFPSTDD